MGNAVIPVLFSGLDYAMDRLRERLAGITEAEYFWEPVADVWTVREVDGVWRAEPNHRVPDPAPVTTIAWRIWHLASDCFASYSDNLGDWPLHAPKGEWYGEVAPALVDLDVGYGAFRDRIHALGEDGIWRPLGPDWGPYADDSWAALVVHAQDELSHHGAEVALLRDLYLRLG